MQKRCNGAKQNGIFSKCLQWICKCYAFQRNATTSNCPLVAKSHPAGMRILCDICRHFASVMLHFASLITHNLRCIPAYTHQIPNGISSQTFFGITCISILSFLPNKEILLTLQRCKPHKCRGCKCSVTNLIKRL